MYFYWRSLFFVACNNPIHESIHISIDHRIWVLSDPSLCGVWLLCMAEIQKILSGSNLFKDDGLHYNQQKPSFL